MEEEGCWRAVGGLLGVSWSDRTLVLVQVERNELDPVAMVELVLELHPRHQPAHRVTREDSWGARLGGGCWVLGVGGVQAGGERGMPEYIGSVLARAAGGQGLLSPGQSQGMQRGREALHHEQHSDRHAEPDRKPEEHNEAVQPG